MKYLIAIAFLFVSVFGFSQDVLGLWKVVDEEDGKEKLTVNIYEHEGKIYGKIVKIIDTTSGLSVCKKCTGDDYNAPLLGLHMIKNMEKVDGYYKNGTIVDPRNGKIYKSSMQLMRDDSNTLQVRGYISIFYKTQYWLRVQD